MKSGLSGSIIVQVRILGIRDYTSSYEKDKIVVEVNCLEIFIEEYL